MRIYPATVLILMFCCCMPSLLLYSLGITHNQIIHSCLSRYNVFMSINDKTTNVNTSQDNKRVEGMTKNE